ncbi:GNAT family N-acetyltransferase [Natronospora cellulosivora (SeqCode)]
MNLNELYKLEKKDIAHSAELMSRAFYDYPLFKYILGNKHNEENMNKVLKFLIKYGVLYGQVYANSADIEGIILFSDYRDYKFTFYRTLRAGGLSLSKLGADVGKRFSEYESFTENIHKKHVKKDHQYIILLGVDPDKQGQGYGKKLLNPILEMAANKEQATYLETHG